MSKPQRPQQVTSACLFIGVSSLLLLWFTVSSLTSWNSLEIQEGLTGALEEVDLQAVGLTVQGTIDGLRTALLVVTVPLVAGVVFAVYAARGHEQSRIFLTAVAVLTALAFTVTGGLIGLIPAAFAVYAVVQLWSRESRRWFALVNDRELPPDLRAEAPSAPTQSAGATRPDPFAPVPPSATPEVPTAAATPVPASGPPPPVRTAALVTSIATGAAAVLGSAYLAIYLLARDTLVEAQADSPFASVADTSEAEIAAALRTVAVLSAVALGLGLAAVAASVQLVRGRRSGLLGLVALSGITIVFGVFTLIGIPWAAAAVWVLVLLRRPKARAWVWASSRV